MSSEYLHPTPRIAPGSPFPLGATPVSDDSGQATQFAVHAPDANSVDVCLVSKSGGQMCVPLTQQTYGIWHGVIDGVSAGQRYGYRVNSAELLIDPWAKRITATDSPSAIVTAPSARTTGPRLETPWEETVIHEVHVGSYTAHHPHVPSAYRGTYLGLAEPTVIGDLLRLGVTAVELRPVQAVLAYFAPHPGYASVRGHEITEFHTMVDALHAAGIEVLLDVDYSHTCEQSADGHSPIAVRMITDSLRYWAADMGVDGFRFDLAAALGRPRGGDFDPNASVLTAVATDPLLSRCKLIAQPWDATKRGYQLGNFGRQWSECNDSYRDVVRRFWNGDTGVREFATRITGSEDLFLGRRPWASINFVTAHDGFTAAEPASQMRAVLATLALSTGTPLFRAGEELRTQGLDEFVGRALALRRAAPALRQAEFFEGRDTPTGHPDLVWFGADGTGMTEAAWHDDSLRTIAAWIDGSDVRSHTADGHTLTDDSWLLVFHAGGPATVTFGCPEWFYGTFRAEFDSTAVDGVPSSVVATNSVSVDGPTLLAYRAVG